MISAILALICVQPGPAAGDLVVGDTITVTIDNMPGVEFEVALPVDSTGTLFPAPGSPPAPPAPPSPSWVLGSESDPVSKVTPTVTLEPVKRPAPPSDHK